MGESLVQIVTTVTPVFALIALGWVCARTRYLSPAAGDGLADYVVRVAVPLLLFRTLASEPLPGAGALAIWTTYFAAIAAVWALGTLAARHLYGRDRRTGVVAGVSTSYANLVLLGIPFVERVFGPEGLQVLLLVIAVHLPVMMLLSTVLMERAVEGDAAAGVDGVVRPPPGSAMVRVARAVLANPLIVGILAGLAWRATGLGLPGLATQLLDYVARTTGPVALVALGLSLVRYGVAGDRFAAGTIAALALIVQPALVLAFGSGLALPERTLAVLTLCAALPTGINAWLIATHFKVAQGLSGSVIALACLGSFVTLPLWLYLVS